jgi:hypothetical protein
MAEEPTLETTKQNNESTAGTGAGEHQHSKNGQENAGAALDQNAVIRRATNENNKRRDRQLEADCLKHGIEPIKNDKGRIDQSATIDKLADHIRKAGAPEAAAILEQRYSGQINKLTEERDKYRGDFENTRVVNKVREKLAIAGPVDLDESEVLFLRAYTVKFDEDSGDPAIFDKRDNPLYHKLTAQPLTLEDAVEEFFEKKPHLRDKQKGNGLQGLGAMKGAPGKSSGDADLVSQLEVALANKDKQRVAEIQNEMKRRIKKQYGD